MESSSCPKLDEQLIHLDRHDLQTGTEVGGPAAAVQQVDNESASGNTHGSSSSRDWLVVHEAQGLGG